MKEHHHLWYRAKLSGRARDARQAEEAARRLFGAGYPHSSRLANIHARAALVYEQALAQLDKETETPSGPA